MVRDDKSIRRPKRFEIADVIALVALIVILGGALCALVGSRSRAFAARVTNWLEANGIVITAFTAERHDVYNPSR
jgi:hypothetical protein